MGPEQALARPPRRRVLKRRLAAAPGRRQDPAPLARPRARAPERAVLHPRVQPPRRIAPPAALRRRHRDLRRAPQPRCPPPPPQVWPPSALPPLGVCQFFSSAPVFFFRFYPRHRAVFSCPCRSPSWWAGGARARGVGLARAVVWFDRAGSCWVRIVWVSCHAPSPSLGTEGSDDKIRRVPSPHLLSALCPSFHHFFKIQVGFGVFPHASLEFRFDRITKHSINSSLFQTYP